MGAQGKHGDARIHRKGRHMSRLRTLLRLSLVLVLLTALASACESPERPVDVGFVPETITFPDGYKALGTIASPDKGDETTGGEVADDASTEATLLPEPVVAVTEPAPEPSPEVVEETTPEIILDNSKGPGVACQESGECISEQCISGEFTSAHCALLCEADADCKGPDQLWNGTCSAVGGAPFKFCIFFCGAMGGECPGDLTCDGAACR